MNVYEGSLDDKDYKIAIVVSRMHDLVTEELLKGSISELGLLGISSNNVSVYKVPGYLEIPRITKKIGMQKRYDAIICLPVLIRENFSGFDFTAMSLTRSLLDISLDKDIRLLNRIVFADSIEEALQEAGIKEKNSGRKAAFSAIELISLESKME